MKEKILKFLPLILFAALTFCLMFLRPPFWDEANAWMISKSFNLIELFKIEKYDGHLFIWHFLLMPFSKNDLFYPYSMYILNWIFCILSMFVFWKFAPFKQIEKTLITFSFPIFWYFAQVARCYSIGLLFLFLILTLWKERTKKPILISFLLILLANTSAMALIGAFSLGLIFIFDILKEKIDKKNLIYSFLILFFGAMLVYIQLFGAEYKLFELYKNDFISRIITFFFIFEIGDTNPFIFIFSKILSAVIFINLFFAPLYLKNSKSGLLFFIVSYSLMLSLFIFKYPGSWWHYLFFFIFLIAAIWLKRIETNKKGVFEKPFNILFFILISLLFFETFIFKIEKYPYVYFGEGKEIANVIKKNGLFENVDKVVALDYFNDISVGINPYFKNLKMYDVFGHQRYTPDGYKNNIYNHKNQINYNNIYNILDKNSKSIAISSNTFDLDKQKTGNIKFTKVFLNKNPNFIIYELEKN